MACSALTKIILSIVLIWSITACVNGSETTERTATDSFIILETSNLLDSGISYYKTGEFDEAEKLINESIEKALKIDNDSLLVKAYNNLGNIYADQGKNVTSLNNYQKALKLAETNGDSLSIARINKNIGAIYVSWKRLDESLSYYLRAEASALSMNNRILYADCHNNIGTVYEQKNDWKEAIKHYAIALTEYENAEDREGIAMIYSNLGIAYKKLDDRPTSIDYYKKSLAISESIDDKWAQAATLNNLGNLYGEAADFKSAQKYCKESLQIAQEINAPEITVNVFESLADAAYNCGKYKESMEYMRRFIHEKNEFENLQMNNTLSELTVRYETEKKDKENTLLKLENKEEKMIAERAHKKMEITLVSGGIILVFSLISFRFYQLNSRHKQANQERIIRSKIAFETEQSERKRMATDLHDSIGQKLSVVKMQLSAQPEISSTACHLLDETIDEIRTICHNLLPPDLKKGLLSTLQNFRDEFNFQNNKGIKLHLTSDDLIPLAKFTDELTVAVYRIVQEFTTNTLKYAQAGNIHIDMEIRNERLHLNLSDDGVGIDPSKLVSGHGIGLKNIKDRVKQFGGHMTIQTEQGTDFQIEIPL
jgi:signal transduction histidine kinase